MQDADDKHSIRVPARPSDGAYYYMVRVDDYGDGSKYTFIPIKSQKWKLLPMLVEWKEVVVSSVYDYLCHFNSSPGLDTRYDQFDLESSVLIVRESRTTTTTRIYCGVQMCLS